MNLISCAHCGVVLDQGKIRWHSAYDDVGYALPEAEWDGDKYVMPSECPVCKGKIYKEEE